MAQLNWKGKLKVTAMGAKEALHKHTPEEREFIKEHGHKAREVLGISRSMEEKKKKLAKKMLNGLHEKWTSKKVGGMSYLGK